jgi:hypothetical protein
VSMQLVQDRGNKNKTVGMVDRRKIRIERERERDRERVPVNLRKLTFSHNRGE